MSVQKAACFIVAICFSLSLFGCGGGGAEVKTSSTTSSTTLGQELKDLKEARDKNIISESEYQEAKERIIKQRTAN